MEKADLNASAYQVTTDWIVEVMLSMSVILKFSQLLHEKRNFSHDEKSREKNEI